ncbi:hypothetical protein ACLOJK_036020 [Asimina triloba]
MAPSPASQPASQQEEEEEEKQEQERQQSPSTPSSLPYFFLFTGLEIMDGRRVPVFLLSFRFICLLQGRLVSKIRWWCKREIKERMKRTKGKGGGGAAFPLECSSGCESGWTMYLENQSFGRKPTTSVSSKQPGCLPCQTDHDGIFQRVEDGEEEVPVEEEDLSMVSDASSGPPHMLDEDECFDESGYFWAASYPSSAALAKKSSKRKATQAQDKQQHPSLLDDTASSHVFSFSKSFSEANNKHSAREDVLEFSHSEESRELKGILDFLFCPFLLPANAMANNQHE